MNSATNATQQPQEGERSASTVQSPPLAEHEAPQEEEAREEKTHEAPVEGDEDPKAREEFERLLAESLAEPVRLRKGQKVQAVVVELDEREVLVDVGMKAEASIAKEEFLRAGMAVPRVGETIEAVVVGRKGAGVRLSVLALARERDWQALLQAKERNEPIRVRVEEAIKGGFRVRFGSLQGFLPRSEADVQLRGLNRLIGQEVEAIVLRATRGKNENIVVSRKAVIEKRIEESRKQFFATHQVGDRIEGVVRRMTDFGAFVEVAEGVDALLHVSDISWRRLDHPREALKIGQKIQAEIVALDPEANKVAISMKALQPDPWETVSERYQPGMRLTGRVRRLIDAGAIVEVEPGVEGFIHRSELSWTQPNLRPADLLAEGDVVDVVVLEVQPEQRRLRLSLKAAQPNPWEQWLAEHPVGSRIRGVVQSKTDFGIFVRVGENLDGLVHASDLSWTKDPNEALAEYEPGQEVECVVLNVDVERERIALGIKQLEEDPFEVFCRGAKRGGKVQGRVRRVQENGMEVELTEGVVGFVPRREIPRGREFAEGDEVEARIVEIDKRRRRIVLSIRRHEIAIERETVRAYTQQAASSLPSPLAIELQRLFAKERKEDEQ